MSCNMSNSKSVHYYSLSIQVGNVCLTFNFSIWYCSNADYKTKPRYLSGLVYLGIWYFSIINLFCLY